MAKHLKKVNAKVLENIEVKQIASAVRALQKFVKKQKKEMNRALLQDEHDNISLVFTMTQVPVRPSPKPMQIVLPNSFTNKEQNSRVCVFVKDPVNDFKEQI